MSTPKVQSQAMEESKEDLRTEDEEMSQQTARSAAYLAQELKLQQARKSAVAFEAHKSKGDYVDAATVTSEDFLEVERRKEAERNAKAEEARLETERIAEEKRIERERIAELARLEVERIAKEKRIEAERIAEEERKIAEAARIEAERFAEEERIERERIARVEERARRIAACGARFIKSTPPDLKIIVKAGEKDVETDDYELMYHSDVMAEHSQWFDDTIHEFREKGVPSPWEIRLDDVSFDDWETMIRFLDPTQSRFMAAEHVLQVSEYYDQYDFPVGRQLCDAVLTEYFLKQDDFGLDVLIVVDAVAVAYKAHLREAYKIGNPLLKRALVGLQDKLMETEQAMSKQKTKADREIASLASASTAASTKQKKKKFPGSRFLMMGPSISEE